ncbi:CDCA2 protein, partial [Orthonyx spaldingii]|nr:CDCA2 protein [Orthonyx spaldingii]
HDPAGSSSPEAVGAVEGQSPAALGGNQAPVTPPRPGNGPGSDPALLRSILKKTPLRELRASPQVGAVLALRRSLKEYSNSAIDRGVGESAAVSNCVKAFEPLQTETTESQSSKTPKKKKVTFGEVLSPEIFDQSLPANTPLCRGASPGQSPWARPGPSAEPLPLLDFGWDDECVEPLQEFVESSVGAEAPSLVENAEVAETGKPDITTHSSAKRKDGAGAEDSECSSSGATDTRGEENSVNPRRNKAQRQKNPTTAAPR